MERLLNKQVVGILVVKDGHVEERWIHDSSLKDLGLDPKFRGIVYGLGADCYLDSICIATSDGKQYMMYHPERFGEDIWIESINGDIFSLIGQVVTKAEEVDNFKNINKDETSL